MDEDCERSPRIARERDRWRENANVCAMGETIQGKDEMGGESEVENDSAMMERRHVPSREETLSVATPSFCLPTVSSFSFSKLPLLLLSTRFRLGIFLFQGSISSTKRREPSQPTRASRRRSTRALGVAMAIRMWYITWLVVLGTCSNAKGNEGGTAKVDGRTEH